MKPVILMVGSQQAIPPRLRSALIGSGYELVQSNDLAGVADCFGLDSAHILIVDLDVPLAHGWTDLASFARLHPNLCLIGLTERSDAQPTAIQAGLCAVAEKPIDRGSLLKLINDLMADAVTYSQFYYLSPSLQHFHKQPNRAANRGQLPAAFSGWGNQ